jgi:hypothetical protein
MNVPASTRAQGRSMFPLCRFVLVCEDGHITAPGERVIVEQPNGAGVVLADDPAGDEYALVNPVHAIRPPTARPRYPVYRDVVLYAQLSDGGGRHRLSVELIRWYQGFQYFVFHTPETLIDFGTNPTAVVRYYVRLTQVIFPVAAQYSFRLHCGRQEIGQAEVELEVYP